MEKSDLRAQPAYTLPEVSRYLGLPVSTLRRWSAGRPPHPPLIRLPPRPGQQLVLLSFFNLVELHVLAAVRRRHGVSMSKAGCALDFLRRTLALEYRRHPLLGCTLVADGLDLFVEKYVELNSFGRTGRAVFRETLDAALQRIVWDDRGLPMKLYPFVRGRMEDAPIRIAIEPGLSAGRPIIDGTGLAAEVIAERHRAGESIDALAQDYGRPAEEIVEAVGCC